ncbi:MAG: hypothetical protein QM667_00250 [Asticcacaulis sp.]
MAKRKKHKWVAGDVFRVTLSDGSYILGQILSFEELALWSYVCALSGRRFGADEEAGPADFNQGDILSVIFIDGRFDHPSFTYAGSATPMDFRRFLDIAPLRKTGFIGAKIYGCAVVMDFLNSYFGLDFWDQYLEPDYFQTMLLPHVALPEGLRYSKR